MKLGTVFCIDGSGNQDQRTAERKRPIYHLDCESGCISRPLRTEEESALEFFRRKIDDKAIPRPILIAVDVPIGLPAKAADVLDAAGASTFLTWLANTSQRLTDTEKSWRQGLIADGVSARSPDKPFVSIAKNDKLDDIVQAKRLCDEQSYGESVFCVDHGRKQVGKAALQFWFDVLVPLQEMFKDKLAVWPFQTLDSHEVIIAECYPAECQRRVYGKSIKKRQSVEVAKAVSSLLTDKDKDAIETKTWIYAGSSEDEFDMFTTAFAFRKSLGEADDFFWYPADNRECAELEGWMLGLKLSATENHNGRKKSRSPRKRTESTWTRTGSVNRNEQENIGPAGVNGPKGPLFCMMCRLCGHRYNTNAQDIFQKRCPLEARHPQ